MKLNYSNGIIKSKKKTHPLFNKTPIPVDSACNNFLRFSISNSSVSELYELWKQFFGHIQS
jgi:hypothetical protein